MQGFATHGTQNRRLLRVAAGSLLRIMLGAAALMLLLTVTAVSQVLTVTPEGVDGHYLDFHPTNIPLPTNPLTENGKQELIRFLTGGTWLCHATSAACQQGADAARQRKYGAERL